MIASRSQDNDDNSSDDEDGKVITVDKEELQRKCCTIYCWLYFINIWYFLIGIASISMSLLVLVHFEFGGFIMTVWGISNGLLRLFLSFIGCVITIKLSDMSFFQLIWWNTPSKKYETFLNIYSALFLWIPVMLNPIFIVFSVNYIAKNDELMRGFVVLLAILDMAMALYFYKVFKVAIRQKLRYKLYACPCCQIC